VQVEGAGDLLVAVAAQVDVAAAPELVPGQDVTLQQPVEPVGVSRTRPRAAAPGSAMARSLEVYRATSFSMVTGSPSRTSRMR